MNAAEDRLSEIMDAATRALAPPIDTILAEGERLGRRRRRRRHAAAIATGTAVVVLAGGIGVAASIHLTRATHSNDVAAAITHPPSHAPTSAANGAPGATPSPSPTSTVGFAPITAEAAQRILQLSGGAGWKFGVYDTKAATPGSLLDGQIYDTKGVVGRVVIVLGNTAKSGTSTADCSKQDAALLADNGYRPDGALPPSCTVARFPNGDQVLQEVTGVNAYSVYEYRIIAYRADGIVVSITVGNGDWDYTHPPFLRAVPPLSIAQWTSIALDRSWQFKVPPDLNAMSSPMSSP